MKLLDRFYKLLIVVSVLIAFVVTVLFIGCGKATAAYFIPYHEIQRQQAETRLMNSQAQQIEDGYWSQPATYPNYQYNNTNQYYQSNQCAYIATANGTIYYCVR